MFSAVSLYPETFKMSMYHQHFRERDVDAIKKKLLKSEQAKALKTVHHV